MRLGTIVAAIVLVVALGAGAAFWLLDRSPAEPADPFAERFAAQPASSPSAELEDYAERLLFDMALAFVPAFVTAPQSVDALAPHNMTRQNGTELALALPAEPLTPPVALDGAIPSSPPLDVVPLPPSRPKVIIDNDRVIDDDAIAKLKQRLRLNANQVRLWDPIEAELRGLTWRRPPGRSGDAHLDIASLQRLKAASDKLMEGLREDQKREVKSLMGIVGL